MRFRFRLLPLFALALLLPAGYTPASAAASASMQTPGSQPPSVQTNQAAPASKPAPTRSANSPGNADGNKAAAPAKKLDMNALIERLKQTHAIGVLTKLVLRSDVNDLIDEVRRYKKAKGSPRQLDRIRAHFNGLLLKVLALLDDDPKLAQDIQSARDSLWQHLMEVKT